MTDIILSLTFMSLHEYININIMIHVHVCLSLYRLHKVKLGYFLFLASSLLDIYKIIIGLRAVLFFVCLFYGICCGTENTLDPILTMGLMVVLHSAEGSY